MLQLGITQERVAVDIGIDPGLLNRYLRGIRPMPEGLEARINAALGLRERAEQAAREARERVLAGHESDGSRRSARESEEEGPHDHAPR